MLYPLSYRGGGRQEAVRVTHEAPGDVDDRTGAARDRAWRCGRMLWPFPITCNAFGRGPGVPAGT